MSDIVERLRSNKPLPICPFERMSPEYYTTPNDKPCKFCGGEPEDPDRCTGADTRIMGEAADEITGLRQLLSEKWRPMNIAPLDGTEILIRTKDGCVSCAWDNTDQEWVAGWLGIALLKADPLGWMAIPKTEMHGDGE